MRSELTQGAWLELLESWLTPDEAEQLRADLVRELRWEQRHIVLFGKPVLQPRLIAWAGELPYRYSGQTLEPRPWPAPIAGALEALQERVSAASGARFNHVLVNRYRDGKDSMGYHADAEPELVRIRWSRPCRWAKRGVFCSAHSAGRRASGRWFCRSRAVACW